MCSCGVTERCLIVSQSLDLHQAAHAHLCSALLRIKSIAEFEKLPALIKDGMPKPELTEDERIALHNVTSGLSNRQEVRAVIDKAIPAICKALGVPVPDKKRKGKKPEKKDSADSKDEPEEAKPEGKKPKEARTEKGSKATKPREDPAETDIDEEERAIAQLDDLLNSTSGEESEVSEGEEAEGKGGKAKKAAAATKAVKRVEPLELDPMEITDDEDADEEDSADDGDSELDPMEITDNEDEGGDESADSSPGSDDEEPDAKSSTSEFGGFSDPEAASGDESSASGSSSASSIAPPPKKKKKAKQAEPVPLTGSTFLPSLMGGYISGSDSEASDIDIAPSTNKNRRGQRARQAIWEKRYKEQAKHLKKQQEKRDSGWDTKYGAVEGDAGQPWKRGIRNPLLSSGSNNNNNNNNNAPAEQAPPPMPKKEKKRDDTGPLHPSWEAKRKAKENQKASAPYEGTKITFD